MGLFGSGLWVLFSGLIATRHYGTGISDKRNLRPKKAARMRYLENGDAKLDEKEMSR
jgi:hypothetical protein